MTRYDDVTCSEPFWVMHSGSDLQLCSRSVFATVFTGNIRTEFHRVVFPSFHPFPLFNLFSAGWPGGKQCAAPAVGPVNHSQHTSLFADDTWKTQRHRWEWAARREASYWGRANKKLPLNPQKWLFFEKVLNSAKYKMVFPSCSVYLVIFFCCHGSRSALPMRWRLFGVLVCCFQGPVLRQGAQLSLDHSQHRLQQVSHGQLS